MKLIFLGPPGAGKGTQAARVCERHSIPHISTGDMLRNAVAKGTETGLKAKAYMDAGKLVPDDILVKMVDERLSERDCVNGYLLDGFPRTVIQAEALEAICAPDMVIDVDVEDEKLLKRLTGRRVCSICASTWHISHLDDASRCPTCAGELYQREDDKPETILNRLNVYHTQTAPLIGYYAQKGILRKVNGDNTPDAVFDDIMSVLGGGA